MEGLAEIIRREEVVVIAEDEKVAAGLDDCAASGAGQARVCLADDLPVRVPRDKAPVKRRPGSTVDEDEFPARPRQRLLPKREQRGAEIIRSRLVGAEQNGKKHFRCIDPFWHQ